MPISILDTKTALILIDLQKGIVALPSAHPIPKVTERARALVDGFRSHGLPIVFVHVIGAAPGRTEVVRNSGPRPPDWAEFVPELECWPQDIIVSKRTWGAFSGTDLEARLRALGVTQVVLAGVATSIGVESTARQAHELGFNVALAIDAMTDSSPDAHENSIRRIFPRLGETAPAGAIVEALARREAP